MKKLIKILAIIFVLILAMGVMFACVNEPKEATINIVLPDGAPALAVSKIMKDFKYKEYKFNYEIVEGTEISTKITQNEADIAIMPINLASVLYNKGIDIKLISSNVFGLLYLVGNSTVSATSISDLDGKKIYCIGQGGTPDYVLQYVLAENNVEAEIEYVNSGSDVIPLLKAKKAEFAVLGEPAATMSTEKAGAKILFDMQEEWKNVTTYDGYPQAGAVVRGEIAKSYPKLIKAFYEAMQDNITYIENEDNITEINARLKEYNSSVAFSSADVIKKCNLRVESAIDSQKSVENYLTVFKDFKAASIGGKLPDANFYYKIK